MLEASSEGDYLSSMLEQDARFNSTMYQGALMAMRAQRAWTAQEAYVAPDLCLPRRAPVDCTPVPASAPGKIRKVTHQGETVTLELADATDPAGPTHQVVLSFHSAETLRVKVVPYGTDRGRNKTVVEPEPKSVRTSFKEKGAGKGFFFSSEAMEVHGLDAPFRLEVKRQGKLVWSGRVHWSASMTTLEMKGAPAKNSEFWYGGGMQNGYMEHSGRKIGIYEGGPGVWDKGGHANPVPFAMSSRGYGVFRNTFAPGEYQFHKSGGATLSHGELGADAFIFVAAEEAGGMKEVLGHFLQVTGRPVVPPVWALSLGDSDCYNNDRHHHNTEKSALTIEEQYAENDLPVGWMMVNDGYGCGYTSEKSLKRTRADLEARGMRMGLWTEDGLEKAQREIGADGNRVIKTDVKWVGSGYDFGINAVKTAAKLMQDYGKVEAPGPGIEMSGNGRENARPFTWTVCGWAGTSAYAVVWTGDSEGNWQYIAMQVPAVIGSGLSGQHLANGDVDGIFGGSAETYVRDLQWKTFLPVAMTMSGWSPQVAGAQKQPWAFGDPYTSFNRESLRLRHAITPYMYSLVASGHHTGVPPVRAMALEYPECSGTHGRVWDQFMSGPFFLVAPVMLPGDTRTGVRLPGSCAGKEWIDFWTGKPATAKSAEEFELESLGHFPVYVTAGAVIPMWEAASEKVRTGGWGDALRLEVFVPSKHHHSTTPFTLFEDDGDSMAYAHGEQAQQELRLQTTAEGWSLHVGPSVGDFAGKPENRSYTLGLHSHKHGDAVYLDGEKVAPCGQKVTPCVRQPTDADRLGGIGALPAAVLETGPRSLGAPLLFGNYPAKAPTGKDTPVEGQISVDVLPEATKVTAPVAAPSPAATRKVPAVERVLESHAPPPKAREAPHEARLRPAAQVKEIRPHKPQMAGADASSAPRPTQAERPPSGATRQARTTSAEEVTYAGPGALAVPGKERSMRMAMVFLFLVCVSFIAWRGTGIVLARRKERQERFAPVYEA